MPQDPGDAQVMVTRTLHALNTNIAAFGRRRDGAGRGQAAVELALIIPIVLCLMVVGIQFALVGVAALGLGQVNYQGARYAATNPSASQSAVQSYMVSVASPIIS